MTCPFFLCLLLKLSCYRLFSAICLWCILVWGFYVNPDWSFLTFLNICVYNFSRNFQPSFLQMYSFCLSFSLFLSPLLSFLDFNYTYVRPFDVISQIIKLCLFFSYLFFSLGFSLGRLYCCIEHLGQLSFPLQCWSHWIKFSFYIVYFSFYKFYLILFYIFHSSTYYDYICI